MTEGWQFNTAPWVLITASAFLVASIWFFFRSLKREGSDGWHIALHLLRLVIAIAVAVTLLKPERVVFSKRTEQPRVVVLWDGSGSMKTKDTLVGEKDAASRESWVKQQLDAKFWEPLAKRYNVTVESFSVPSEDPKSLDAETQIGSDLNTPLDRALKQYSDLRAVVMISDGDRNLGENPITAATALARKDVPIYTVGVGSETFLPDIEVLNVLAPSYALINERVSVVVNLQNRLPREVKTTITIAGPGGSSGSKKVTLPAMAQAQEMIVFTPQSEGAGDFKLSIPVEREEVFSNNNEKTFPLAVRKETLKVLVVDSQPRWEFRYLRNALQRDPSVVVNTVLYHPQIGMGEGVGYLPEFPTKKEDLQGYDVVFLGDIGVGQGMLSPEQAQMLAGLVKQQASGLVFLPGPLGRQKSLAGTALEELIPVETDYTKGIGVVSGAEARLELSTRGLNHWLTMLATDPNANQAVWRGLPGFYWYAPVVKAKGGAEVLATHEAARTKDGRIPLLVTRAAGNGKVLYMGTDSAWRWRKGVEDTYHYRFWGQVVRWMSHQRHLAQEEGIRFFYTPEQPRRGDKVRLNATVMDKLGAPVTSGKITVTAKSPDGTSETLELVNEDAEWGVFTGQFIPREGGKYELDVASETAGRRMKTSITVSVPTLEKEGMPARLDVLREMSALTQGKFHTPPELPQLVNSLSLLPERKPEEIRLLLWCHPYWCAGLLAAFVVYWVGRKLGGLI